MKKLKREKALHDIFLVSILIKGLDGILETIGGIFLLFVRSGLIADVVQRIFRHELAQDPTDLLANYLIHTSQNLSLGTISFASLYLLIHGIIKIGLVTGLWLRKLWAYPLAGVILALFIVYQGIRFFHTHSVLLLFLTIVDMVILALIRFEYRRLKRSMA